MDRCLAIGGAALFGLLPSSWCRERASYLSCRVRAQSLPGLASLGRSLALTQSWRVPNGHRTSRFWGLRNHRCSAELELLPNVPQTTGEPVRKPVGAQLGGVTVAKMPGGRHREVNSPKMRRPSLSGSLRCKVDVTSLGVTGPTP